MGLSAAQCPYTVNAIAERAAVAVLRHDADWVAARVADAIIAREWLTAALRALGLASAPSEANFLFVPVPDAARVAAAMAAEGIRVRAFENLPPISPALASTAGAALRITVAPQAELEPAVAALRRALERSITS